MIVSWPSPLAVGERAGSCYTVGAAVSGTVTG
jgi:hypothetical protein